MRLFRCRKSIYEDRWIWRSNGAHLLNTIEKESFSVRLNSLGEAVGLSAWLHRFSHEKAPAVTGASL